VVHIKIETTEEKYLTQPDISKATYNKVISTLRSDEANLQNELIKLKTDVQVYYDRLNELLPKLADLRTSFEKMTLEKQKQFINVVFNNSLYFANGSYRTPSLHELFAHKELELKEKGLLIIEKPFVKIGETPISTPNRSSIQIGDTLADKLTELQKIFAA
ncbi:MAG TPA: hypothetical protein VMY77_03135, partial [Chitinophagaceae bacterium]|nr:hypothetical protein [Chitinophagaceae bacterium]